MLRILIFFSCLLMMGGNMVAFAAQSTVDVPVSAQQKDSALKEILGADGKKMQREQAYVIGIGDILSVGLYEEGDMSATAAMKQPGEGAGGTQPGIQVMMDGRISLKDIGDVEVSGLTLAELADYLKKLYSKIYDNPIVITTLVQSNSLNYTVMGKVLKPGIFKLEHPMTLVQVVAQAGGFDEWAGREITVVRKNVSKEDAPLFKNNTLKFDYADFIAGKALDQNIFVRSGDIIIID
ncbi:polysaccharide export protein [Desulfopila sp. IMCC35006]|uniref:polysaccharide biosynthesis/export family protein n=1 Tax=Desulfopila sp. IMCC35006 TaxID=2569542 RepID=UPI0010ACB806|nr:polysaccharide biosynthesis/export family protein [Desulfopila sp. IMCC35006]TKB25007.1 polysaccharide export protein [Desulfopila sp. IMCC35006]